MNYLQSAVQLAIKARHDLHLIPEIGLEEYKTQKYLTEFFARYVKDPNVEIKSDWLKSKTGLTVLLKGKKAGKLRIGLRADIDALPVQEDIGQTSFAASSHPGKMHACGHDAHTSMLLGAFDYLYQERNFTGEVLFIFQPAEENLAGAKLMMEAGLLKKYPLDAIFGLHNWPDLPVGSFGLGLGGQMAATDEINFKIIGKGGHAAFPHQCIDPIVIGSHLITSLQTVISRRNNPICPAVLSFGLFQAGHTHNVIPSEVLIKGTLRSLDPKQRVELKQDIQQKAQNLVQMYGAKIDIVFKEGYPVTFNTPRETQFCQELFQDYLKDLKLEMSYPPSLGGEDFAYFLEKVPGCYIKMGIFEEKVSTYGLHSPHYKFNDKAIEHGIRYWHALACKFLA